MTWSIASIPRADRGAIWAAAEQLQRHDPTITAAAAFTIALLGYERGARTSTAEQRIAKAAIDNPSGMFQARARHRGHAVRPPRTRGLSRPLAFSVRLRARLRDSVYPLYSPLR